MWDLTRSLDAKAAIKLNSPASTAAATMVPSFLARSPGASPASACDAPRTPMISRQAAWAGSEVPPPTVPTSMEGMVTLMCRSSSSPSSLPPVGDGMASNNVMQLADSTTCAGSCPQARNTALTTLAACALKPPTLPAMADPTKFLRVATSTIPRTVVLRVSLTILDGIRASHTTDFPRPSIQLIAAGFLSLHTFPEMAMRRRFGNGVFRCSITARQPLETMFIPMASPAKQTRRTNTLRPATTAITDFSFPNEVVASNAPLTPLQFAGSSTHSFNFAASVAEGRSRQGARVMPSFRTTAVQPPDWVTALAPRLVLATKQPSVVAMGT
mmetsp:Transcript_70274/g.120697  ORF Transcript_70274/g.120697 Transcript_70274/m.120697 type:complete len:328 (-) Transcript_70274:157-1140(-)